MFGCPVSVPLHFMLSLKTQQYDQTVIRSTGEKNVKNQFRGSENQRIIDMKETRKTGEVILHELNKFTPMKRSKNNE